MNIEKVNINLSSIRKIAIQGINRTSLFMGLGLNAAYDEAFRDYDLTKITYIQLVPPDADEKTIAHFKEEFGFWIIECGLRELIETFAVFLDKINEACVLMTRSREQTSNKNLPDSKEFLWKGIEKKLQLLREKFNVGPKNVDFLVSINQTRNCLVHRRGFVGTKDCRGTKELTITWRGIDLFVEVPSGEIIPLDRSTTQVGLPLPDGGTIKIKYSDRIRSFQKGARISLSAQDLAEICYYTLQVSDEIINSTVAYAKSINIPVQDLAE